MFDIFKRIKPLTKKEKLFKEKEEEYILIDKIKNPYPHYRIEQQENLYETKYRIQKKISEDDVWKYMSYVENVPYNTEEEARKAMDEWIYYSRKERIREASLLITYIYPKIM